MQFLEKLWWGNRDIKLVPTDGRKNYLVTKSNYQTKKMFQYNLLGVEMKTVYTE